VMLSVSHRIDVRALIRKGISHLTTLVVEVDRVVDYAAVQAA